MFLIVLVYVTCYLALIERYKPSLLAMLPAFLVYFLVAGLQFDVGTDYFSYVDIFYDNERNQLYFNRNEFFFFWLNDALNKMGLPAQSLFLAISFVQASLLFIYLKKIKAYGISLWLLFFVFYVVTNIYNNQLNGLRQFVVVSAIPLLTILLFEKRYLRFLAVLAFVSFFHNTAWFVLFLAAAFLVRKAISSRLIYLFLVSAIGYLIIGVFIYELVEIILPSYSHYLLSDHADEYSILSFITKLYYLPLIFYFFSVYKKGEGERGEYIDFMVSVFVLTYWFFLLSLSLGIAARFYYYLMFFYIFPIYYLLERAWRREKKIEILLLLFYIAYPYVAKVTFLAKNEFLYKGVIFN